MDLPKPGAVRLVTLGDDDGDAEPPARPERDDIGLRHEGDDDIGVKLPQHGPEPRHAGDIGAEFCGQPVGRGRRDLAEGNAGIEREERLRARRIEGHQSNVVAVRVPLIGKERRHALGASGTEARDDEGNAHLLLASQELEPDVDRVVGVMGAGALARRETKTPAQRLVTRKANDGVGRGARVLDRHDQPGRIIAAANHLARAWRSIGDDGRKSAGHGLQQRIRRSFEARGHHEELGAAQIRERI